MQTGGITIGKNIQITNIQKMTRRHTMQTHLMNYINGDFIKNCDSETMENINPATGELISKIPLSKKEDVQLAVDSATNAQKEWSQLSIEVRANYLDKIADELESNMDTIAKLESRDTGKPITLARNVDATRSVSNFRFFAEMVRTQPAESYEMSDAMNYTLRKPIGTVGLITPWNLPLYLLSWKVAPALAMGNTVIAKPSELTPMTADYLAKVMDKVGLPDGVFNLIHGIGKDAGQAVVEHPSIGAISFTGGTETGKQVAKIAAPLFKKISLELGGKNSSIVFADCEIKKTVSGVSRAAFLNNGQVCLAGSRILVEKSIFDLFVQKLCEKVSDMKIGNPSDTGTELGSLVSQQHLKKIQTYIKLGIDEGGTIIQGGKIPSNPPELEKGAFIEPTIISNIDVNSRISTEEIFGPVVTIHPFDNELDAISIANNVDYGLAASVWSQDIEKAERVSAALETGMVWINTWLHRDLRVPFGGVKSSGVGREGGRYSLEFFSETQNICIKY